MSSTLLHFTYRLVRSSRQTVAVEIQADASVLVRSPWHMSLEDIEAFLLKHAAWVGENMAKRQLMHAVYPEPSPEEAKRLMQLAKHYIPERVAYYGAQMGLQPSRITITSARTRYGSCSAKNALSFSWRIMQYPLRAVDYVIVHELAHIPHKNHSAAFYARIAAAMPDHQERRALFREMPDDEM